MNKQEFVAAVHRYAVVGAATSLISMLERPPGRRPDEGLKRLSSWYRRSSEADREAVHELAALATNLAAFDVLAIIDGVAAVAEQRGGRLEMSFVTEDRHEDLKVHEGDMLHDLLPGSAG